MGFGLRIPLKDGGNRPAIGVLLAVPARPHIEDLGKHDGLLLFGGRRVQNLVPNSARDHEIDRSLARQARQPVDPAIAIIRAAAIEDVAVNRDVGTTRIKGSPTAKRAHAGSLESKSEKSSAPTSRGKLCSAWGLIWGPYTKSAYNIL